MVRRSRDGLDLRNKYNPPGLPATIITLTWAPRAARALAFGTEVGGQVAGTNMRIIVCTNHLIYDSLCELQLQEFSSHPGSLLVPKMPYMGSFEHHLEPSRLRKGFGGGRELPRDLYIQC